MNIINQLLGIGNVAQGLSILLQSPNALTYSKDELLNHYVDGVTETEALALELCGTANQQLALSVMSFNSIPLEFFNNVAYNSYESIPLVVRVLNIALMNEHKRVIINEPKQASSQEN